jgi:hypothetical protein
LRYTSAFHVSYGVPFNALLWKITPHCQCLRVINLNERHPDQADTARCVPASKLGLVSSRRASLFAFWRRVFISVMPFRSIVAKPHELAKLAAAFDSAWMDVNSVETIGA